MFANPLVFTAIFLFTLLHLLQFSSSPSCFYCSFPLHPLAFTTIFLFAILFLLQFSSSPSCIYCSFPHHSPVFTGFPQHPFAFTGLPCHLPAFTKVFPLSHLLLFPLLFSSLFLSIPFIFKCTKFQIICNKFTSVDIQKCALKR